MVPGGSRLVQGLGEELLGCKLVANPLVQSCKALKQFDWRNYLKLLVSGGSDRDEDN